VSSGSSAEGLVEYIVSSIVDHPDEVSVRAHSERGRIIIEVSVADSDMGRVIGKRGSVVNSIRKLLDVQATKHGKRVTLEIT
jgi:predicted RNA-binding protein YlqC (UPF0109 family)